MRRIQEPHTLIKIVWLIALIIALAAMFYQPGEAQDAQPFVCRDTTVETPRFVFHNLPAGWEDGSVVWWALYEGGAFEDGVLVADAYTENEDVDLIGTATVGSADYSFELRGDATTPPCERPPESTSEPSAPTVQIIMRTGRTCVVKYPEIVLVCHG